MGFSDRHFILAGEAANYVALALNAGMTSAAMLGLPDPSAYDPGWTSKGFCIIQDDAIPTEVLSSLPLVASAIALHSFAKSKKEELSRAPLLGERMTSGAFANAAHGLGHLLLWAMGDAMPPLELSLEPAAIAYLLNMIVFWVGTLRLVVGVPATLASCMAFAVLAAQYLLGVRPELAFTYSQSVILLAQSLNLLRRKAAYSGEEFLYFAASAGFLPLFAFFHFETKCGQSFLAELGGHAVYDLYLSLQPFMLYYAVTGMKQKRL